MATDIGSAGDTGRDPEVAKTGSTRFVVEWELAPTTTTPQASAGDPMVGEGTVVARLTAAPPVR
jgi:hypothetical protein